MLHRLYSREQRGFTLIEVLIALAVTGIIGVALVMVISQLLTVNSLTGGHMATLRQVENAVYYINRDTQMSQHVQAAPGTGFPLTLTWKEWDGTSHRVSYKLVGNTLERNLTIDSGEPRQSIVAHFINPALTSCLLVDGVLTCKITASVGGWHPSTETRTLQVAPRPAFGGI